MSKKVIETKTAATLETLIDALKSFSVTDPATIYTEGPNGHVVVLHLVENTLSDGSIVYDVVIQESVKS